MAESLSITDREKLVQHKSELKELDFTDCQLEHHKKLKPGGGPAEFVKTFCPDRGNRPHCPHAEAHVVIKLAAHTLQDLGFGEDPDVAQAATIHVRKRVLVNIDTSDALLYLEEPPGPERDAQSLSFQDQHNRGRQEMERLTLALITKIDDILGDKTQRVAA